LTSISASSVAAGDAFRHPLQTSDAVGAAAVQIGPEALATAAVLNKQLAVSFGKIATFFGERFGLHIVPSTIVRGLQRAAAGDRGTVHGRPSTSRLPGSSRASAAQVASPEAVRIWASVVAAYARRHGSRAQPRRRGRRRAHLPPVTNYCLTSSPSHHRI
jgi:hypothetical protein